LIPGGRKPIIENPSIDISSNIQYLAETTPIVQASSLNGTMQPFH